MTVTAHNRAVFLFLTINFIYKNDGKFILACIPHLKTLYYAIL